MLTIWFIGMYVIFILQQITIFYLCCKLEKYKKNIHVYRKPKIFGKDMKIEYFEEVGNIIGGGKK